MERQGHVTLPFGRMNGGIMRRVADAAPNQLVDGLDVIEDAGDLRRRDAFASVAVADPHMIPVGSTHLVIDSNYQADRVGDLEGAQVILVGVGHPSVAGMREQFNGIHFSHINNTATLVSSYFIDVSYWNGTTWVLLPWFWNDTDWFDSDIIPLGKNGIIAWHLEDFSASWVTSLNNGVTAYWIRIRILDTQGVAPLNLASGGLTIIAPGVRCFHLAPVNGLFPVQIEDRSLAVICADRQSKRGLELGASIGVRDHARTMTRKLWFVLEQQAGWYGDITWPQWQRNGVALGGGGAGGFTANEFNKLRRQYYDDTLGVMRDYDWQANAFRGATLFRNFAPSSLGVSSFVLTSVVPGYASEPDRRFEHGRLYVRTSGGGASAGDMKEIVYYDRATGTLYWYDPFGGAPNASARFDILGPPVHVLIDPLGYVFEIDDNGADTIDALGEPWSLAESLIPAGWSGMMYVVQEPRFMVESGMRYTGAIDPTTGRLLLLNGGSPMISNGRTIQKLTAEFESDAALIYAGGLADVPTKDVETDPKAIARGVLRIAPPTGKYIAIYRGSIFIAGLPGDPLRVIWSAPGGASIFWPLINEAIVRDTEQGQVTGMVVSNDRLVVFTSNAIHEANGPDDNGLYSFRPVTQGVGFVHQNAVCTIVGADTGLVVGVSHDGVFVFDGSDPRQVLEDWSDVIDGGVNHSLLNRAIACAYPEMGWVLFAVPSAGAQRNDRIVVWNFKENKWWVWTARWGVSAMALDRDAIGRTQLWIGTDDGFVQTLVNAEEDDGQAIDGFAVSAPIEPQHATTSSPIAVVVNGRDIGSERTMTVGLVVDENYADRVGEGSMYIDAGELVWDEANWSAAPAGSGQRWTDRRFLPAEAGVPSGVLAQSMALRVSGTSKWALREASVRFAPKRRRGIR